VPRKLPLALFASTLCTYIPLFSPYVDGIVVGSAIVKMIAENSSREDLVSVVSQYAREMKQVISVSLPL
jgi:hypothetical protein